MEKELNTMSNDSSNKKVKRGDIVAAVFALVFAVNAIVVSILVYADVIEPGPWLAFGLVIVVVISAIYGGTLTWENYGIQHRMPPAIKGTLQAVAVLALLCAVASPVGFALANNDDVHRIGRLTPTGHPEGDGITYYFEDTGWILGGDPAVYGKTTFLWNETAAYIDDEQVTAQYVDVDRDHAITFREGSMSEPDRVKFPYRPTEPGSHALEIRWENYTIYRYTYDIPYEPIEGSI